LVKLDGRVPKHRKSAIASGGRVRHRPYYNQQMDIVYQLQGVAFEWDSHKAQSNVEKHGVTFEEATEVFFDPFYQTGDANPIQDVNSEQRTFIIGYSLEQRLLLVIYIEPI
jgi:uncharacterized protein